MEGQPNNNIENSLVEQMQAMQLHAPVYSLRPHQEKTLCWMQDREQDEKVCGGIVSLAPGLGKTFVTLTLIMNSYRQGRPTLVICPTSARITWKAEAKKFFGDHCKLLSWHRDDTKIDHLTMDFINQHHVVLAGYEYVRNLAKKYHLKVEHGHLANSPLLRGSTTGESCLFSQTWARVVCDESHAFANPKTALFSAMCCISANRRWCLTGTPIRNCAKDLHTQLKFVGLYEPEFIRKEALKAYYMYMDYPTAGITLPPVTTNVLKVQLAGKQLDIYDYYLQKAREAYNDYVVGGRSFASVLTMFLRLRQVCIAPYTITPQSERGYKPNEEEEQEYVRAQRELARSKPELVPWINDKYSTAGVLSQKITQVIDVITSIPPGNKIIVFTMFKRVIDLLREALSGIRESIFIDGDVCGKHRESALHSFKTNDSIDVLFLSYKVGSESLNITEANHIILVETWWTPTVIQQAIARSLRIGQTQPVTVYELVSEVEGKAEKSIETKMLAMCKHKTEVANSYYYEDGRAPRGGAGLDAAALGSILF